MQKIKLRHEPSLEAKHRAFAYQTAAFNSIRDLEYAAIFHEQGLGKTKIAIDLLLYWLEYKLVDTVLIVVKKGLIHNWVRELVIHTSIRPLILTENRYNNFYIFNTPTRVMLAHYEAIKIEKERIELFLKTRNVAIILDESSKIKNPDSEITRTLLTLAPLFVKRIIMTGTPVANRPYDIWSQIFFLDQGMSLGTDFIQFRKTHDLSNELVDDISSQDSFVDQLIQTRNNLSKFIVRETKDSGVISLPQKTIRMITTDWEPRQLELYKQLRDEMNIVILRNGIPTFDDSEAILKRLLRLVQIASNPKLVDNGYNFRPGKLDPLFDVVQTITRKREKCIIWTGFTENVDWLAEELSTFGSCKLHGKLDMEQRTRAIDKFMTEGNYSVLVATPGTAKEGLTLTVANHAIFYDRSFSLDDYLQAQDRIHRVSQVRECEIINLLMRDSIDEWVEVLLAAKQLAAQLTQGDISKEYYESKMEYSFGDILKNILRKENRTSEED